MEPISTAIKIRPELTDRDAVRLAEDLYGIRASARELPSERDQNFYLSNGDGGGFDLKIGSSAESLDILEFQNAGMSRVAGGVDGIYIPTVFGTYTKSKIEIVEGQSGANYHWRLV